jgi:hypothetical protein
VRAEFFREAAPEAIVGTASWAGGGVEIEAEDPKVRRALGRVYRPTSVLVDDPSLRPFGASGPGRLAPGSLRWFVACATARSPAEKLAFRLVPDAAPRMGWDPAGAYRTFAQQVERAERLASSPDEPLSTADPAPTG